jgi:hypothetical protein
LTDPALTWHTETSSCLPGVVEIRASLSDAALSGDTKASSRLPRESWSTLSKIANSRHTEPGSANNAASTWIHARNAEASTADGSIRSSSTRT